jgi:hypothetical protein
MKYPLVGRGQVAKLMLPNVALDAEHDRNIWRIIMFIKLMIMFESEA